MQKFLLQMSHHSMKIFLSFNTILINFVNMSIFRVCFLIKTSAYRAHHWRYRWLRFGSLVGFCLVGALSSSLVESLVGFTTRMAYTAFYLTCDVLSKAVYTLHAFTYSTYVH